MKCINLDTSLICSKPSYSRFADVQQAILAAKEDNIELHINIEKRFGLSLLFCISTLPLLARSNGKNLRIICNEKSKTLFYRNGYIPHQNYNCDSVDIAPDLEKNSRIITAGVESIYSVVREITKEAPVEMSEDLASLFTSKVGEMYNNSLEHSGAEYVIGGKYFKNQKNIYCFSCYDTGIGIPENVIQHIDKNLSEMDAFKWAMKRGNSTASKEAQIPRGLGLGLLQNFVKANDGAIRICSGRIMYTYGKIKKACFSELDYEFEGTLFEMDIIADNQHKYILK